MRSLEKTDTVSIDFYEEDFYKFYEMQTDADKNILLQTLLGEPPSDFIRGDITPEGVTSQVFSHVGFDGRFYKKLIALCKEVDSGVKPIR